MEKCIDIAKMYWGKLTTASKVVFVICTLVTIRNLCSSKSIPDFFSILISCIILYVILIGITQIISKRKKNHTYTKTLSPTDSLPVIANSNLMLSADETCHYCGQATFVKTKNVVVGYSGGSRWTTVRVAKGVSFRIGSHKAAPVRSDVEEKTDGILSITNKRIVFSANKGAFDKKLSAISSVTPHKGYVAFQFGDHQYPLETKDSEYIYQIISRIVSSTENK